MLWLLSWPWLLLIWLSKSRVPPSLIIKPAYGSLVLFRLYKPVKRTKKEQVIILHAQDL